LEKKIGLERDDESLEEAAPGLLLKNNVNTAISTGPHSAVDLSILFIPDEKQDLSQR
jgi:hypothetical protein